MATWLCLDCIKDIRDSECCPYCDKHRIGDLVMSDTVEYNIDITLKKKYD